MLETVREYGLEQLATSGEDEAVRERHATFFAEAAEAAAPSFLASEPRSSVAWIATELPNLRTATIWALAARHAEVALRLALATRHFMLRADPNEALGWLEAALALPGGTDATTRTDALFAAATLAQLSDLARADALAAESQDFAAAYGDVLRVAKALVVVARSPNRRRL